MYNKTNNRVYNKQEYSFCSRSLNGKLFKDKNLQNE